MTGEPYIKQMNAGIIISIQSDILTKSTQNCKFFQMFNINSFLYYIFFFVIEILSDCTFEKNNFAYLVLFPHCFKREIHLVEKQTTVLLPICAYARYVQRDYQNL